MIEDYGVRAQMLAPVLDGERLVGTISVHHQATTRDWTATEISALLQAQGAVTDWYKRQAAGDAGGLRDEPPERSAGLPARGQLRTPEP